MQSTLANHGRKKRNSNSLFDVTMGSYDGVETCKLVGSYLQSQLNEIPGDEIGLYRVDGLAVLQKTPRATERIRKEICNTFRKCDLKITVEASKKVVNYLDVTLDLNTEKFKPYPKTSNTPLYVHSKSNHPPQHYRKYIGISQTAL